MRRIPHQQNFATKSKRANHGKVPSRQLQRKNAAKTEAFLNERENSTRQAISSADDASLLARKSKLTPRRCTPLAAADVPNVDPAKVQFFVSKYQNSKHAKQRLMVTTTNVPTTIQDDWEKIDPAVIEQPVEQVTIFQKIFRFW